MARVSHVVQENLWECGDYAAKGPALFRGVSSKPLLSMNQVHRAGLIFVAIS